MSAITQREIIDLSSIEENPNVFVVPTSRVNTVRRCSFCQSTGHNIRKCNHTDIEKLHTCAQFMYLTTCRYLRIYPNGEKTHKKWIKHLSTSDCKILAKLNRLDSNPRTTLHEYSEKLHTYYIEYAENELRNDHSPNPRQIIDIYFQENYDLFSRLVANLENWSNLNAMSFAIDKLKIIIQNSGRHLLDMGRIRYWLNNHMDLYYRVHQLPGVSAKMPIKTNHNSSLMKETHDECPICYTDMTNDTMVQLGCNHSFCGDCIIGQIKSTNKVTVDCAMCRSTIKECSSASNQLLQKITSTLA